MLLKPRKQTNKSRVKGSKIIPPRLILTADFAHECWIKIRHELGVMALSCRSAHILGCCVTTVTVKHLLAFWSATGTDFTLMNFLDVWCTEVNCSHSWDTNIPFLLNGRPWFIRLSRALGSESTDISHCLGQWLTTWPYSAFIFLSVKMGLWILSNPPFQDCLPTCRAVLFPVYCLLVLLCELQRAVMLRKQCPELNPII